VKTFVVTIVRTITTEFEIGARSTVAARTKVEEYGVGAAALDYADQDAGETVRIKSIVQKVGP
jgi:hypothetical protein